MIQISLEKNFWMELKISREKYLYYKQWLDIIDLNLIGFIPENARDVLQLKDVGISSLFNILFIIFETLSIFKNMILCKLPIPKKLQSYLENIMKEFTGEIKEKEGEK